MNDCTEDVNTYKKRNPIHLEKDKKKSHHLQQKRKAPGNYANKIYEKGKKEIIRSHRSSSMQYQI